MVVLAALIVWITLVIQYVSADRNVTVMAQAGTNMSYTGSWQLNNDYCDSTKYASSIGDTMTFTFTGTAVYVVGTVDCDWSGLIDISLDGQTPTEFNRRACVGDLCDYPWFSATGLTEAQHKVKITLTGPELVNAPSGHIIADLRYIIYTVPDSSTVSSGDQGYITLSGDITTSTGAPVSTATNGANGNASSSDHKSSNIGPIVGGVIGGLAVIVLALLLALLWYRRKHSNQNNSPVDLDHDTRVDAFFSPPPRQQSAIIPSNNASNANMSQVPWSVNTAPYGNEAMGGVAGGNMSKDPLVSNVSYSPSVVPTVAYGSSQSGSNSDWNPYDQRQLGLVQPAGPLPPKSGSVPAGSHQPQETTNPSRDDDLVHRVAATVANMLRQEANSAPPPMYQESDQPRPTT